MYYGVIPLELGWNVTDKMFLCDVLVVKRALLVVKEILAFRIYISASTEARYSIYLHGMCNDLSWLYFHFRDLSSNFTYTGTT